MALEVTGLYKSYGSFPVLHNTNFTAREGEVHALLGPNGAGKSTLIKCIGGVEPFEEGEIRLDGESLDFRNPADAFDAGVVTIHQHLSLVDTLSIADNLNLGMEQTKAGFIRKAHQAREAHKSLAPFSLDHLSPDTPVGRLSAGTKQLIEIAKAHHRTSVRVLILDEPTSALTEDETRVLFEQIEAVKAQGVCIIYTTHRLSEIYRIADRVTVIRDGGVALSSGTSEVDSRDVVRAIAGPTPDAPRAKRPRMEGEAPLLRVNGLQGPRFGPIDLEVMGGEIVGLYGVLGSGKTSVLETLAGRWKAEAGHQEVRQSNVRGLNPGQMSRHGLGLVPSDRHSQGVWLELTALENLLMPSYVRTAIGGVYGWRRLAMERSIFSRAVEQLDIHPAHPKRQMKTFSGGNQQKVVLGRWTTRPDLRVLLLDEPTQGVDVGARAKIYDLCTELASQGLAVLFASSDAAEVAQLADRAHVMAEGRFIAHLVGTHLSEEELLANAHELIEEG